jgi:LCP family protein required for cell wall assembly
MTSPPIGDDPGSSVPSTGLDPASRMGRRAARKRGKRGKRAAVLSVLGGLVLIGAVAAIGFVVVSNLIPRVHVSHLVLPPGGASQTVLITGAGFGPTGSSQPTSSKAEFSGLIMLLHIDINQKSGAVVSIPPLAIVPIPGRGHGELWDAINHGGPTLLVQTVEQLTGVPINHYARVDFDHVSTMIGAVGGVDVSILKPDVSFGHKFHAGVNQLNGVTALYYVRDKSITQSARVLRQQNLIRAILFKMASRHLLTNPLTMVHVLGALTSMLTVDSDFTNSSLMLFAKDLSTLSGKSGTFLTAPTYKAGRNIYLDASLSSQLWRGIAHNSVAAYAKKYPFTVTPAAIP